MKFRTSFHTHESTWRPKGQKMWQFTIVPLKISSSHCILYREMSNHDINHGFKPYFVLHFSRKQQKIKLATPRPPSYIMLTHKWVFYSSCIICSASPTKISSVVGGRDATCGASLQTIWLRYHVSVYTNTMWKCNM